MNEINSDAQFPEVCDTLSWFESEPIYHVVYDITRFLEDHNPSLLQGLKSIWIYNSIVDDYYQVNLIGPDGPGMPFCDFREECNPEVCPSIHLYIYEILGGAIEGRYSSDLLGRLKSRLDNHWFNRHGRYFLIWNLIWAVIIIQNYRHTLNLSNDAEKERTDELYNAYLAARGITISNVYYKVVCCVRIWIANRRMRAWRRHLASLNPTRQEFVANKRLEYDSKSESA